MQQCVVYHNCLCRYWKIDQNAIELLWITFWLEKMSRFCFAAVARIMNPVEHRRDWSLMRIDILPLRDRMASWSPPRFTTNKWQPEQCDHTIFFSSLPSYNITNEELLQGPRISSSFDRVHERLKITAEKRNFCSTWDAVKSARDPQTSSVVRNDTIILNCVVKLHLCATPLYDHVPSPTNYLGTQSLGIMVFNISDFRLHSESPGRSWFARHRNSDTNGYGELNAISIQE